MKQIIAMLVYDPEDKKYEASDERMMTLAEDLGDWAARRRLFGSMKIVSVCDDCGRVNKLPVMPCRCEDDKPKKARR